jgi:hypothetical protein
MIREVGLIEIDRVSERAKGFCQIATHSNSEDHTAHCEQCRDLAAILPKLKRPGYVKLIGAEIEKQTLSINDVRKDRKQRLKDAKANHKKERAISNRVALLLSGGFVRTRTTRLSPVVPQTPNNN